MSVRVRIVVSLDGAFSILDAHTPIGGTPLKGATITLIPVNEETPVIVGSYALNEAGEAMIRVSSPGKYRVQYFPPL